METKTPLSSFEDKKNHSLLFIVEVKGHLWPQKIENLKKLKSWIAEINLILGMKIHIYKKPFFVEVKSQLRSLKVKVWKSCKHDHYYWKLGKMWWFLCRSTLVHTRSFFNRCSHVEGHLRSIEVKICKHIQTVNELDTWCVTPQARTLHFIGNFCNFSFRAIYVFHWSCNFFFEAIGLISPQK